MIKFRPRNNAKDQAYHGELTAIDCSDDPGRTLQEPAEDADINILMKRMGVKDGSELPHFSNPKAMYGDFSDAPTEPQEIADILYQGQLAFMRIPAAIRQRYATPEDLFAWMSDDANYDEAVKLGLLAKKEPPKPSPIDTLTEKLDKLVSSSTSSDKAALVPNAEQPPK